MSTSIYYVQYFNPFHDQWYTISENTSLCKAEESLERAGSGPYKNMLRIVEVKTTTIVERDFSHE